MNAAEAHDGLAERRDRVRRLRVAVDAALIDRDAFALAVDAASILPKHEIGAYITRSVSHDQHRVRLAEIRREWGGRIAKFHAAHPDVVIPTY